MLIIKGICLLLSHLRTSYTIVRAVRLTAITIFTLRVVPIALVDSPPTTSVAWELAPVRQCSSFSFSPQKTGTGLCSPMITQTRFLS